MSDFFIIPQCSNSIIAQIKRGKIQVFKPIDIPFNSKSVITENNLIIALCFDLELLKVFDLDANLIYEKSNFNYKSIACRNNVVYLGGESNRKRYKQGELFSLINFDNFDFNLTEINLPIKVINGKSIDDILLTRKHLYLVDNVIYPKYLLTYDITTPDNPLHIKTNMLPNNGTYEHIIKGDITENWMVLFSSTLGMEGSTQYVSIIGKEYFTLSSYDLWNEKKLSILNNFYRDICIVNNSLYVLMDNELGFIDLNESFSIQNLKKIPIRQKDSKKILKTSCNRLILISENEYELIEQTIN